MTGVPCTKVAKVASSVAGGQTIRSVRAATSPAPRMILASSADEPRNPFIFQLPATRGRGVSAMMIPVGDCFKLAALAPPLRAGSG